MFAIGHDPETAGLMHGMLLATIVLVATPAAIVGAAAWWLVRGGREGEGRRGKGD